MYTIAHDNTLLHVSMDMNSLYRVVRHDIHPRNALYIILSWFYTHRFVAQVDRTRYCAPKPIYGAQNRSIHIIRPQCPCVLSILVLHGTPSDPLALSEMKSTILTITCLYHGIMEIDILVSIVRCHPRMFSLHRSYPYTRS
jgi:hypothetical protein